MDSQRNTLLTWAYYCHGKSMEELRQSLVMTSIELEATRIKAQEQLNMREDQLNHLKHLLTETIRERDDALEKLLLQQQQPQNHHQTAPLSGISSIDDEPRRGFDSDNGFSSSDCEESIVSSPTMDPVPLEVQGEPLIPLVPDKPLPEKGTLLQAVMKAGPLLQNLLLAGPLPQWRHPPPPIDPYQIPLPPVVVQPPPPHVLLGQDTTVNNISSWETDNNNVNLCGSRANRKRGFQYEISSNSPTDSNKYQKGVLLNCFQTSL